MRKTVLSVVVLLSTSLFPLLITSCGDKKQEITAKNNSVVVKSNEELVKKLCKKEQGKDGASWHLNFNFNTMKCDELLWLKVDNTGVHEIPTYVDGYRIGPRSRRADFRWRVEGNTLIYRIIKSNDSSIGRKGDEVKLKIISVTDSELNTESSNGATLRWTS